MSEPNIRPTREELAQNTIDRLKNISDRLEVAGGHIEATGLRSTTYKECKTCYGSGDSEQVGDVIIEDRLCPIVLDCPDCNGTGYIRTVNDGTGKNN